MIYPGKLHNIHAEQTSSSQQDISDHSEESFFLPAYVEALPDGLIADEL